MTATRPLAVITGASSGIGYELAKQFAEHDHDLLICAEDEGVHGAGRRLEALGAKVEVVQQDLRSYDGVESLCSAITATGREVAALALNAGVGRGGAFVDTALADDLEIIDLNVRSTVHLAKRLLPAMAERNSGKVLITSSIASTMPGAFQSVYNASKAFLQSFAVALQEELKHTDVTVTSLMPGPTETNFFRRAGMALNTKVGRSSSKDDPADVARQGYEALAAGRSRVVASSLTTKLQEKASTVLPDRVNAVMHRVMARPDRGSNGASQSQPDKVSP
jgi:short-subunit dehydrogenase